jgi:hypothetical protein
LEGKGWEKFGPRKKKKKKVKGQQAKKLTAVECWLM